MPSAEPTAEQTSELATSELDTELGSKELGSKELGSKELGSKELGSKELGSKEPDKELTKKQTKEKLLQHPNLWRAGQIGDAQQQPGIVTGYSQLNALLPGGGWPSAALTEFMLTSAGMGELRLLVPALRLLSQQQERWIAWVNPPFVPYAPALQALGVNVERILLIHPRSHDDMLWVLERAGKSGSCSCVLAWPNERKLKLKDTQRLQLASKQGRTLTCLFRPHAAKAHSSMAELRIALGNARPGEVQLDILKRRGGWPVHDVCLPTADVTHASTATPATIKEQLELWRAVHEKRAVHGKRVQEKNRAQQPEQSATALHTFADGHFVSGMAANESSVSVH